jgi:hypothetical protein
MISEQALRKGKGLTLGRHWTGFKEHEFDPETQCIDVKKHEFDTRTVLHCFQRARVWCQESNTETSKKTVSRKHYCDDRNFNKTDSVFFSPKYKPALYHVKMMFTTITTWPADSKLLNLALDTIVRYSSNCFIKNNHNVCHLLSPVLKVDYSSVVNQKWYGNVTIIISDNIKRKRLNTFSTNGWMKYNV